MKKGVVIRKARMEESDAVARLYRQIAGAEWPFLYPHTPEEDRRFFRTAFQAGVVWAATDKDELIGLCALRRGWIDHLFVAHARHGQGIGQALLRQALKGRRRVRLWTFQRNARTRAFYGRQGFLELRLTDGAHNEEREPDVLLEWAASRAGQRPPAPPPFESLPSRGREPRQGRQWESVVLSEPQF